MALDAVRGPLSELGEGGGSVQSAARQCDRDRPANRDLAVCRDGGGQHGGGQHMATYLAEADPRGARLFAPSAKDHRVAVLEKRAVLVARDLDRIGAAHA